MGNATSAAPWNQGAYVNKDQRFSRWLLHEMDKTNAKVKVRLGPNLYRGWCVFYYGMAINGMFILGGKARRFYKTIKNGEEADMNGRKVGVSIFRD